MELLSRARDEVPADQQGVAIQLTAQLARGHMFRDEAEQALAAVSSALEAAERLGFDAEALQMIITKSWALSAVGRFREALALLIGAKQMADDEDHVWTRVRSRFNLSSYSTIDNPQRGLTTALEGVAIDQQYGIHHAGMAGNAAENAFVIGEFDEVLRLVASTDEVQSAMGLSIHGFAAAVAALRGDGERAKELLAPVAEEISASTSRQDESYLRYLEAILALGAGSLAEARRLALESRAAYGGTGQQESAMLAAHIAVLQRDLEAVTQDSAWLAEHRIAARRRELVVRAIEAGRLALEGSVDAARQAYRQIIDDLRAAGLTRDLAFTLLEQAILLGGVDAKAAEGRAEAIGLFEGMGAAGLVERIEAASPAAAKPVGASARSAGAVEPAKR